MDKKPRIQQESANPKKIISSKKPIATSRTFSQENNKREKSDSIKKNVQKSLIKEIETKAKPKKRKEFSEALYLTLAQALDNSKTANKYLFTLMKTRLPADLFDGIYKIDVVKTDIMYKDIDKKNIINTNKYKPEEKGILCKIRGENKQNNIFISNEEILESKPKTRAQGEKEEDFLEEIQYGDSIIIKVQENTSGHIKDISTINPDTMIEEIRGYIEWWWDPIKSAKKIRNAINFLNESNEQNASEYIKDFFKLVREKQKKRKTSNKAKEVKNIEFAEVLKRFINKENVYVHKTNDIDKSSVEFLLKEFGIDKNKVFTEVEHDEVDAINDWIHFDISGTVSGLKTIKKEEKVMKDGKEITITKVKKIVSEHKDSSNEAMLSNRPSSTTQIIFKIFNQLGAIDKEKLPQIQRFVNFVNTVDSMDYQISGIDYKNNYQTLLGLYRFIPIKTIFEYFKYPTNTGFEKLSEEYMKHIQVKNAGKEITLKEESAIQKQKIETNIEKFKELEKQWKILKYHAPGEKDMNFIIDTGDNLKDGPRVAGYNHYGFFKIYPERWNIYIYSPKKLPEMIEWFRTESGHFLIINTPTQEDLEKLFSIFSKDEIGKIALKNDMMTYLKKVQKSIQEKKEKEANAPISDEELKSRIETLPVLNKEDIVIDEIYTAIINSIQSKIAFVSIDKNRQFNGRLKVEDKQELKQFKVWEKVKVVFSSVEWKEEGKLLTINTMKKPYTNIL